MCAILSGPLCRSKDEIRRHGVRRKGRTSWAQVAVYAQRVPVDMARGRRAWGEGSRQVRRRRRGKRLVAGVGKRGLGSKSSEKKVLHLVV